MEKTAAAAATTTTMARRLWITAMVYMAGGWRSPHQAWRQESTEPERRQFPAYDVAWKQAPGIAVVPAEAAPTEAGGGLVSTMQHVVNQARRVEQKLTKL